MSFTSFPLRHGTSTFPFHEAAVSCTLVTQLSTPKATRLTAPCSPNNYLRDYARPSHSLTPLSASYLGALSALSSTLPSGPLSNPPSSPPSSSPVQAPETPDAYMLHYFDSEQCEQHITCKTMYDALVWAREEAHEHASNVRIYKLCHIELAP